MRKFRNASKIYAIENKSVGRLNLNSIEEECDINIGPFELDQTFQVKSNKRLIRRQLRCQGPLIVFTNTMNEYFSLYTMLRAFRLLISKKEISKNIQLLIAISEEEKENQSSKVMETKIMNALKGIEDRVRFMKTHSNERLSSFFNAATVSVIPSSLELFALKAQACGSPVIATDKGILKEIISNGETGLFVEEDDPVDLSLAMEAVISNELMARRMRKKAARRASRILGVNK